MALIPPERGEQVLGDLEARFDRIAVPYKTVNGTAIEAAIFVPKPLSSATDSTTAPVLVNFHGGGLLMGTNPEPFFLPDWSAPLPSPLHNPLPNPTPHRVRDLAFTTPAIFITPAYRLAPETPAVSILTDISDFWTWLHAHLPATLSARWPHLTPDLGHLAAVGESAGGYLALQSALQFNRAAKLRAVIAQYPSMFTDLKAFNLAPPKVDATLTEAVAEYVAAAKAAPESVKVSSPWPERADLLIGAFATGVVRDVLGADEEGRLTLGYALAQAEEVPPPVWIVQGDEDVLIAKAATDELVEVWKREKPKAEVKYTVRAGAHGFDALNTLEDDWIAEGVEFVKGYWL